MHRPPWDWVKAGVAPSSLFVPDMFKSRCFLRNMDKKGCLPECLKVRSVDLREGTGKWGKEGDR